MNYLVMECHSSYAIVLDQQGRFLKVANLGYEIGQVVDQVVEAGLPELQPAAQKRRLTKILSAAACVCLLSLSSWQFVFSTYGTVRVQINPDVQLSVNRLHYVTEAEGLNHDGRLLVQDLRIFGKKIDQVTNEMADRAVEMGFLNQDGKVALSVTSGSKKWKSETEELLILRLDSHLKNDLNMEISLIKAEDFHTEEKNAGKNPQNTEASGSAKAQSQKEGAIPAKTKSGHSLGDDDQDDPDDLDDEQEHSQSSYDSQDKSHDNDSDEDPDDSSDNSFDSDEDLDESSGSDSDGNSDNDPRDSDSEDD